MDTKDDILIITSGEERVKMNVYEWLESPDVQETIGRYSPLKGGNSMSIDKFVYDEN